MPKVKTKIGFRGHVRELEVEIPDGDPPPWGADAKLRTVGTDVPRLDGPVKAAGAAKYTYDVHPKGMLWGKLLHSPWGAAVIKALDVSAAKRVKGVRAIHVIKGAGRPLRYHGDEILAVAADTEEAAEEALRAVKVTYERRDVVATVEAASRPDAPLVFWDGAGGGVKKTEADEGGADSGASKGKGNLRPGRPSGDAAKTEAAIKSGAKVVSATYETQVQCHSSLEPHGTLAQFEKDGSLTLWVSTQGTFSCKGEAVEMTKLPDDKVRVITEYMGGGFGSKFSIAPSGRAAIELAKLTRRPVKVMLTREGENTTGGNRPSSIQKMRAGIARDGALTGVFVETSGTAGVNEGGAGVANPSIYEWGEKAKVETTVLTNAGPSAAFRAPGHPQGIFGVDCFMDECAHAMGMDPIEFRKKNWKEDELYPAQWKLGAEKIGWSRRQKTPGAAPGVLKRGIGMASSVWGQMGRKGTDIDLAIHKDGRVELWNGAQDIGTGTKTLLAIIAGEELGLAPAQVTVHLGDTRWPRGPGSGGSTTAPSMGPAVRQAAVNARHKLFELAAAKLGVPAADLAMDQGGAVVGRGRRLAWQDACALIGGDGVIKVRGSRVDNYASYVKRTHGCQFAEVEVDTETGKIRVVKVVAVQDAGRVINKLAFESQISGGVIQGISYALYEDRWLDRKYGVQMNADLLNYKIAGADDMPEIVSIAFDVYNAGNNADMMGLGEPPVIPTAAAIANAVFNATGVRIRSLPLTPDRVLAALEAKRAGKVGA